MRGLYNRKVAEGRRKDEAGIESTAVYETSASLDAGGEQAEVRSSDVGDDGDENSDSGQAELSVSEDDSVRGDEDYCNEEKKRDEEKTSNGEEEEGPTSETGGLAVQTEGLVVPWTTIREDDAGLVGVFNLIPHDIYTGWERDRTQSSGDVEGAVHGKGAHLRGKGKKGGRKKPPGSHVVKKERIRDKQELHERLQKKLEDLKAARMPDDEKSSLVRRNRKRKREEERNLKSKQAHRERLRRKRRKLDTEQENTGSRQENLVFGRVAGLDSKGRGRVEKKALKVRLREAEAEKQKERELSKKGTDEARQALKKARVENALLKTRGEPLRDDPKRIRKSMRLKKRKKEKRGEKWGERLKEEKKKREARQKIRQDHLKERKGGKKEKGKRKNMKS